ncbi:MAG TPA: hypothetical protein VI934_00725 [Candidatus Nanoarchaeia archaeon]|nr:hypothetical protein [Candidatus Nanoarchaeia archaeon]
MVKGLIGGFLNKKPDDSKGKKEAGNAVPDELPPLGEEASQAAPKANSIAAKQPSESDEEPPDELPSLDEKKPEVVDVRPAPQVETPEPSGFSRSRDALPVDESDIIKGSSEEGQKAQQPSIAEGDSFFAGVSRLLKSGKPVDSLLGHDLLANMKENWNIKKESSKTGMSYVEDKRLNTAINETLAQLRLMESKWRTHRLMAEEYEKLTQEQEEKIQEKEKEFKLLLRRYKLFQQAPDGLVVLLKGSIPVRCISDLINILHAADASAFAHINGKKSELSRLASAIDKRLGEDLKSAGTRDAMLKILDKFVKKVSE